MPFVKTEGDPDFIPQWRCDACKGKIEKQDVIHRQGDYFEVFSTRCCRERIVTRTGGDVPHSEIKAVMDDRFYLFVD